jgi:hypothetical protein
VATPALADRVAQLAVDFSQRQVLAVLREQHHVCWGVTTLRKVTAAVAEAMSPFRHLAQVEQVLTWLQQAAATGGPRRIVLSVGRDGVMLPIRGLQKYKEGAAATVSVFNRWGKRLGTVYLGQMPEAGQGTLSAELTRLLGDVLSAWEGSPLRLVYVTDAGFHPSEYFQQVLSRLPDPRQLGKCYEWEWVVDYYHVSCLPIPQPVGRGPLWSGPSGACLGGQDAALAEGETGRRVSGAAQRRSLADAARPGRGGRRL